MDKQNDFYNVNDLSLETRKELLRYAKELSFSYYFNVLEPSNWSRKHIKLDFDDFVDYTLKVEDHFVVIQRFGAYHQYSEEGNVGEIGVRTMGYKDIFLFMFLSPKNIEKVVKKFNLSLR